MLEKNAQPEQAPAVRHLNPLPMRKRCPKCRMWLPQAELAAIAVKEGNRSEHQS
jgi:hypothetical protein